MIIFALLIAGLGVKAALVPFHGWLPQAMVAPAPVSALLHAVAVVKAGAFGIVRVVYDVFGVEFAAGLGVTKPLAWLAAFTIIYGSLRALFQDDLKRRLAFSTVSQVSYIALGVAIAGPVATIGGVVHLVHQGLMKITLFFCAGNLAETLGIHKISEMHGVGRRMPWTMAAFTVGAFGMIGAPPVAGFISKWYLGLGALEVGQDWVVLVLAGSSLLNAAYFLPILHVAWFREPPDTWPEEHNFGNKETAWALLLPPLITAAMALGAGLLASLPFSPSGVGEAHRRAGVLPAMSDAFSSATLPLVLVWPLLLAMGVAFASTRPLALMFAPWAALPALVAAVAFDDTSLGLPAAMLGSELVIDATGRVFLALSAALWLASGWLARPRLCAAESSHFAVLLLLAMTGGLGMALAGDALLFFTATTLAGYALYGLLVHHRDGSAHRAGRVLVVLLVVSDLLVFELLLILSQEARASDFAALRQAFGNTDTQALLLGLLVVGFGIKAGVFGLHVWLAPVFTNAVPALRPAVIGFMLGAGLLGWLRLAPLGEVQWVFAGGALQWLAWLTLGYAFVVGLLQTQVLSILSYVAMALSAFWVALLGAALLYPQTWSGVAEAMMVAILQSGFALTAMLLLDRRASGQRSGMVASFLPRCELAGRWVVGGGPCGRRRGLGEGR